jgi:hypothetical protein
MFIGDDVGWGCYVIILLLCDKVKHLTDFFLLRSHKTRNVDRESGFFLEVLAKRGSAAL